jgi:phosphoesterase RecJ-like protein
MDDQIKNLAPKIWTEIKQANKILINCHYNPDQDSIGSALAMMHALEGLGKEVTVIKGDSDLPTFAQYLPGAEKIALKNYFEIKPEEFDLFVILDTASSEQLSRLGEIKFPTNLKTVIIDHHASNPKFADINLIAADYPATAQILFDLFGEWGIELNYDIAANLMVGLYGDTGGFRYQLVSEKTFQVAAKLCSLLPDYSMLLSRIFENTDLQELKFLGLALNRIESLFAGRVVIVAVDYNDLADSGINPVFTVDTGISSRLRSIKGVEMSFMIIERESGEVNISARAKEGSGKNVAALMKKLGGGGHALAAGTTLNKPVAEVKADLIAALTEMLQ